MLIIMMNEWFGPGNNWPRDEKRPDVENRNVSFSSMEPLGKALYRIKQYQTAYNTKYRYAINYTLLGVSEIANIPIDLVCFFNSTPVESLPQNPEDF